MTGMAEYVKNTYLLLCGKNAKKASDTIANAYSELDWWYDLESPPPRIMGLDSYFKSNKLSERIIAVQLVQRKILDPYNVYFPIKKTCIESDVDFNDSDFTWIKNEK